MADFVAILNKAVDALGDKNTAEARATVYERARKVVSDKINAVTPAPSAAQITRQFKLLDEAIAAIEARYTTVKNEETDPLITFLELENEVTAPTPLETLNDPVDTKIDVPAEQASIIEPITEPIVEQKIAPTPSFSQQRVWTKLKKTLRDKNKQLLFICLGLFALGISIAYYFYSNSPTDDTISTPRTIEEGEKPKQTAPKQFTQRLNADGTEVDVGSTGEPQKIGEGTTIAPKPQEKTKTATAVTQPPTAIFYEEKTGTGQSTADQGTVTWSLYREKLPNSQAEELGILGDISIPEKGITAKLTIKRNLDKTLPASHIIEILFATNDKFTGGVIESIQRLTMKETEQAPGDPLIGIPAQFGDGVFLIALTDEKSAIERNISMLMTQKWIDLPLSYGSGRRALLSFEKGVLGTKIFQEVLESWKK